MPTTQANNIKIAYERMGDPSAIPIILLMGLGAQLVMWPDELLETLRSTGHQLILMDNRDSGLSQKMHSARPPHPVLQSIGVRLIGRGCAPYRLEDMAEDTAGLITKLALPRAHIVGTSMGGMIAQILASKHADKVRSVTLISSTTGAKNLPSPDLSIIRKISKPQPPARTRHDAIEQSLKTFELIGTKGENHRDNGVRDRLEAAYERCYYPQGKRRQTAAIIETGNISAYTETIAAPLLAIHGSDDPLVPSQGGRDAASRAKRGEFFEIEGMAHDLPSQFISIIGRKIKAHIGAND